MACGVFPGDLEESVVRTKPVETRIPAAVHLSQEPGLQTDPSGLDAHSGGMQRSEGDSTSCVGAGEQHQCLRSCKTSGLLNHSS